MNQTYLCTTINQRRKVRATTPARESQPQLQQLASSPHLLPRIQRHEQVRHSYATVAQ
jgi:hypothetical protein